MTLTGTEVHEPKGVVSANLGEVYVADGNGSGNWSTVGTSSFTGMIADFTWPVVQTGWLECDGSDVSASTYGALYDVMTIQMTGTRISGNPTITSLSSTANMRVGYFVFGVGIASGTTIASINSGTQITLSGNASSSGTATIVVSPWLLNTGTIRLPDLSSVGRYRRSRTPSTAVGQTQVDNFAAHTHGVAATTGTESADHTHFGSGTTGGMNANNPHSHSTNAVTTVSFSPAGLGSNIGVNWPGATINSTDINHGHDYSFNTGGRSATHTHSFSTTSTSTGSTETRPISIVLMTCVKY